MQPMYPGGSVRRGAGRFPRSAWPLAGLILLSLSTPGSAQVTSTQERDARIRAAEAWATQHLVSELAPGASAALVHDQEIVWSMGYGYADLESRTPVTPSTAFSICSVSKLFTAVAVMRLHEEGLVDLDEPLGTYLPDFELEAAEGALPEPITIRSVLAHAGGLPQEGVGSYWNEQDFPTAEELRAGLDRLERLYTPLTNFQYSNLGISLLGQVITRASGQPYHEFVREEILRPLGLNGMSPDLPADAPPERFATGYTPHDRKGDRKRVEPYVLSGLAPAAGYAASAEDLARFASWQFRLMESGRREVLGRRTLRNMHRVHWTDPFDPESGTWGLGFAHGEVGGEPAIGHAGQCIGYRTDFKLRPPEKVAVVAMVNANDVDPAVLTSGIYAIAGKSLADADGDQPAAEGESEGPDLGQYEGAYRWPEVAQGYYVIPTAEGLHLISLFARDPGDGGVDLEHVEGDVFRRKRKEGGLGEAVRFLRDETGAITTLVQSGYRYERVE